MVSTPKEPRAPRRRRNQRLKNCTRQNAESGRPNKGPPIALCSQQFLTLLGLGSPRRQDLLRRPRQDFSRLAKVAPLPHNPGPSHHDLYQSCLGSQPWEYQETPTDRGWGIGNQGGCVHLARFRWKLYSPAGGGGRPKVARAAGPCPALWRGGRSTPRSP